MIKAKKNKKEENIDSYSNKTRLKTEYKKTESTLLKELYNQKIQKEENNFLMAINLIKKENLLETNNISEFSKLSFIQNKYEHLKYINNPLKKSFSKTGNKIIIKPALKANKGINNIPFELKEIININKKNIQNEKNKNIEDLININLKYKKENLIKTPNLLYNKENTLINESLNTEKDILIDDNNLLETPTNLNESIITLNQFSKRKNIPYKYYTPTSSNNKKLFYLYNKIEENDPFKDKFYRHLSMKSYVFRQRNRSAEHFYFYSSPNICRKKHINKYFEKDDLNISNFQNEMNPIFDITFLNNLIQKEKEYENEININYIYKCKEINPKLRAQIFCLICSICENIGYKRDTYHLATYNIDRYCSKISNKGILNRDNFILIALTSLEIAAKIEEVQIIKINEYINLINELDKNKEIKNIVLSDIISLEKKMMIEFNWKNHPNTLNLWLNWHICQWDVFIETVEDNYIKLYSAYKDNIIFFKKKDNNSYHYYIQITQIIDLISLDFNYLSYDKQYLIVGAIFVILKKNYDKVRNNTYINIFEDFVKASFGEDVLDDKLYNLSIKYVQKITKNFIQNNLFSYELPAAYQIESEDNKNYNFEEFVSFQIYNENLLSYSYHILNNEHF